MHVLDSWLDFSIESRVWLSPSSCVALAPGITVEQNSLVDLNGDVFAVNGMGALLCRLAARPIELGALCAILARRTRRDYRTVLEQASEFFSEMALRGLVSISQSAAAELLTWLRYFPVLASSTRGSVSVLNRSRFPLRYHQASLRWLLHACLEGFRTILWVGVLVSLLLPLLLPTHLFSTLNVLIPTTRLAPSTLLLAYLLFSIAVSMGHEVGHYLAARLLRVPVVAVYARHGGAGVIFRGAGPRQAVQVLAAGPLAGFATAALISAATYLLLDPLMWVRIGLDQFQLFWYVAVGAVAASQLLFLTPISKDGRAILHQARTSWTTRRSADAAAR